MEHQLQGCPLVVGYSGGPDSKALLYALLACQKSLKIEIHVAHVDHGWREGSFQESVRIGQEVSQLKLAFHGTRLESVPAANKEAVGRRERSRFFQEVCLQVGSPGVFLGHHADDLAETVLKRILEGAHLRNSFGMEPVSQLGEMKVFRPFLVCSKQDLLGYLGTASYLEDTTNKSSQFLRGRMRETILPFLQETFGKEVGRNLCKLSAQAIELKKYFEKQVEKYARCGQEQSWGILFDFSRISSLERVELDYFLRSFFQKKQWVVSFEIMEGLLAGILQSKNSIEYKNKSVLFRLECKKLFVYFKTK